MLELIYLIVGLAVVGFVLWLVITYIPMPEPFKRALLVLIILAIVIFLAQRFLGGRLG